MQQAAQNGEVVEIDLTSLQGFQPTSGLWSPAGHALLRVASVSVFSRPQPHSIV
jgi:hypothetical protein